MDLIFKIVTGVLFANMLTAMFLYSMVKARHLKSWDEASADVLIAAIVPIGFVILGFIAYG